MTAQTVGEQLAVLNTKMDQVLEWQTNRGYVLDEDHDRLGAVEEQFKTYDQKLQRVSDRQGVVAGIQTTVSLALAGIAAWLGMRT